MTLNLSRNDFHRAINKSEVLKAQKAKTMSYKVHCYNGKHTPAKIASYFFDMRTGNPGPRGLLFAVSTLAAIYPTGAPGGSN